MKIYSFKRKDCSHPVILCSSQKFSQVKVITYSILCIFALAKKFCLENLIPQKFFCEFFANTIAFSTINHTCTLLLAMKNYVVGSFKNENILRNSFA